MNFNDTKEQFLDSCTDGDFYDSSLATYRRKLEVFFEFLIKEYGVNDNNYREVLIGIDSTAITKSIEFYVIKYNISYKNTIDTYISVIKSYFDFLNAKLNIKNDNFDSASNYLEIKNSIDEKIKELELEVTTEQKSPIAEHTFTKILNACDEILNTYDLNDMLDKRSKIKKNPMDIFISAIVTKLIMITGIKPQVIDTIKLKDYDKELKLITINNFTIHLPNNYGKQMKKYMDLREHIAINTKDEFPLLIKKDGSSIGTSYEYVFKVLQNNIGNSSAESVAKYTIMQMIKKGMNFSLIKKLTKFGIDSCMQCQELVNLDKINEDITSQNRYIDSKLRSMEIFDLL